MYAGFAGAKNRPNQIAATLTERQRFCWLEGKHWTEMGEQPGKVQARVVEFSAELCGDQGEEWAGRFFRGGGFLEKGCLYFLYSNIKVAKTEFEVLHLFED